MKYRLARGWPEIFWPTAIWLVVSVFSWLTYWIDGFPYTLETFLTVVAHLVAYVIPIVLYGQRLPTSFDETVGGSSQERNPKREYLVAFRISMLFYLIMFLLYVYMRKDMIGIDMSEARRMRANLDLDNRLSRLYSICSPLALSAGYFCTRWNPLRKSTIIFYTLVLSSFIGGMVVSGARYELFPVMLIWVCGLFVFQAEVIYTNVLWRIAKGSVLMVLLAGLNIVLNIASASGGLASSESEAIRGRGAAIASSIGIGQLPESLDVGIALIDEYLLKPIQYLSIYFCHNDLEPARGSHQFWILTNRLKLPAAHQIKAEVDTLYEPYGIYRNVWGTLIRELNIDFGYFGSIFFLFLMGLAVAFCKRQIRNSCTAQFVYLYLFSIMIFSPFSSILKAQCMQSVIYAIVPLFVAEILLLKRRQNAN
jgi:hypothetical protein